MVTPGRSVIIVIVVRRPAAGCGDLVSDELAVLAPGLVLPPALLPRTQATARAYPSTHGGSSREEVRRRRSARCVHSHSRRRRSCRPTACSARHRAYSSACSFTTG